MAAEDWEKKTSDAPDVLRRRGVISGHPHQRGRYDPDMSMRMRPLGWELVCFLVVFVALVVGLLAGLLPLVVISVVAAIVLAPIVLVSFLVRLLTGILDEDRRIRASRALLRR